MTRLLALIAGVYILHIKDVQAKPYFGTFIGPLSELEHQVSGDIYAVDSKTIHVRGFSYDGTAPDAYFYAGTTGNTPSDNGIIIPDENGSKSPLRAYRNQDVTITLPDNLSINDVLWISIWCKAFAIDFGHVMVPRNFEYPRPQKIGPFPTFDHGVTSDSIVVVDAQTFLIPNFHYDGTAPDAFFWVGKGDKADPKGIKVPDENGSLEPLKKYSGKTIVITLPGEMTVFDIDYISIWCRAFYADFGHVKLPNVLNIPPSLKMLGVAPQTKLNCEVLHDDLAFEVRWAIAGDSIVMQLVGKVDDGNYMSFGLSGNEQRSVMVGGDVTVAWLDQVTGKGDAVDYFLDSKSQCQGGRGACPDSKISGSKNNARLLNAAFINGFTMLTYQRSLKAKDRSDKSIKTRGTQAVIWAIGPVNSQGDTSYHSLRLRGDMLINFGRSPEWNCPLPGEQRTKSQSRNNIGPSRKAPSPAAAKPVSAPWYIPPIPCSEPEDGVFYAQIGPTGGDRGYNAITGHVGWGISWYINGLLIPEINVVRGKTYTFVVEGGSDPSVPAKYHPFYITDDSEGGYEFKTKTERKGVRVFAGVDVARDGSASPTAFGRLCVWERNGTGTESAYESFGAYQRALSLNCQEGQPGILQWTPDRNTPDTVYYQCYTHRYLGWKINVVDTCSEATLPTGAGGVSTRGNTNSRADYDYYHNADVDFDKTEKDLNDVTLGGSTRYESSQPTIQKPQQPMKINFPLFDLEDKRSTSPQPIGFESFPFDVNTKNRESVASHRKPLIGRTRPSSNSPSPKNDIFNFPKLPPIDVGITSVKDSAMDLFRDLEIMKDKKVKSKNGLHAAKNDKNSIYPIKYNAPTRKINPMNVVDASNQQSSVASHSSTKKKNDILDYNPPSNPSKKVTNPFYTSRNSQKNKYPVVVRANGDLKTFPVRKLEIKNSKKRMQEISDIQKGAESILVEQNYKNKLQNSKITRFRPSKKSSFRQHDPKTGLSFALNEGFDPTSVVFESDFRPLFEQTKFLPSEPPFPLTLKSVSPTIDQRSAGATLNLRRKFTKNPIWPKNHFSMGGRDVHLIENYQRGSGGLRTPIKMSPMLQNRNSGSQIFLPKSHLKPPSSVSPTVTNRRRFQKAIKRIYSNSGNKFTKTSSNSGSSRNFDNSRIRVKRHSLNWRNKSNVEALPITTTTFPELSKKLFYKIKNESRKKINKNSPVITKNLQDYFRKFPLTKYSKLIERYLTVNPDIKVETLVNELFQNENTMPKSYRALTDDEGRSTILKQFPLVEEVNSNTRNSNIEIAHLTILTDIWKNMHKSSLTQKE